MKLIGLVTVALLLAPLAWAQEAAAPELHGIKLERVATSTQVADRQPVGESTSFPVEVGTVYCYTQLQRAEGETKITHVWYHGEKEMARVDLPVRSSSWRTWSSKKIPAAWSGDWKVVILDEAGERLGSTSFTVGG